MGKIRATDFPSGFDEVDADAVQAAGRRFGASAPGDVVYDRLGFGVDRVVRAALNQIGSGPETEAPWRTS